MEYLPRDASPGPYGPNARWRALTPRFTETFKPGNVTRTLEPAEEFEAFCLDVAGRFDFSGSGFYRITARFDETSGIGPGKVAWMLSSGADD